MPSPKLEQPAAADGPRLCDCCSVSPALLFCRADEARLCLACDRQVHAANVVSSRHPRGLLCDSCGSAPASSLCCTQQLLLCHNCDFDAHRTSNGAGHVRRPVEPFSGCPGAVELMGVLGVGSGDEKRLEGEEEEAQEWVWEEKQVFNFEGLLVPVDSGHGFQAFDAPPLSKDRNLSCGKHKDEILRQLRGLLRSEFDVNELILEPENGTEFESPTVPNSLCLENENLVSVGRQEDADLPENEIDLLLWEDSYCNSVDFFSIDQLLGTSMEENQEIPDGFDGISEYNQILDATGETENDHIFSSDAAPLVSPRAQGLSGVERNSAINRYREKRKTRRYDKRVIYESRKTRAESRVRIKGRFAKSSRPKA